MRPQSPFATKLDTSVVIVPERIPQSPPAARNRDATSQDAPATPFPEPRCPLCGEPNGCEPVRTGSFAVPCWCAAQSIPAQVLAHVPPSARGRACLCRACASSRVPEASP